MSTKKVVACFGNPHDDIKPGTNMRFCTRQNQPFLEEGVDIDSLFDDKINEDEGTNDPSIRGIPDDSKVAEPHKGGW